MAFGTLALACSSTPGDGPQDEGGSGEAILALGAAPAGVECLRLRVAGARSVERLLPLTSGEPTSYRLGGLPLGAVVFSGAAFARGCEAMKADVEPIYISDRVPAEITPEQPALVQLFMHQNGIATVDVDFEAGRSSGGSAGSGTAGGSGAGGAGGSANLPPHFAILTPHDTQDFTTFIGATRAVIPLRASFDDPEGTPVTLTWAYRAFSADGTLIRNDVIHSAVDSGTFDWTVPNGILDMAACQRLEGQVFHIILTGVDEQGLGGSEMVPITIGCAPP